MKRALKIVAFIALSSVTITPAVGDTRLSGDDKLRETQVSYVVEHEDGTNEPVVVKYEAYLKYRVWQSGSASKPLKGKLVDDRKCHISLDARVFRRAYVVTRAGVHAPVEEYQAIYSANHVTDRGPDNSFEALTRHVTCGDVNLFRDRIEKAKSTLVERFDALIAIDDDKTRERLLSMLVGKKIALVAE